MKFPRDYSCVFLSYDEPAADYHYDELLKVWPEALRVKEVKGLDAAHKACAALAQTQRFFIIDGDNLINPNFLKQSIPKEADANPQKVYSWGSLNNVNGLFYGNGGVKFWDRDTLLKVESHENAREQKYSVDFCYGIQYQPMDFCASFLWISGSAYQAFRAGFREGVKFCLIDGTPISNSDFPGAVANTNLSRLMVWCSVGRDKPFGAWAMLGARLGISSVLKDEFFSPTSINDYDSIRARWVAVVKDELKLDPELVEYEEKFDSLLGPALKICGEQLRSEFHLPIVELDDLHLDFFRKTFVNPSRSPELQF